jgi:hypothetical protein
MAEKALNGNGIRTPENKVPCYKMEGHWRFFRQELISWLKERRKDLDSAREDA